MAGRRPLPTETKIAEGNRGHRTIEADDFQPERRMPEMPKGLSRSAKREWYRLGRVLFDSGVLTEVDGKSLAAYCEAFAQAEEALRDIKVHGQVTSFFALDKETGQLIMYDGKPVFTRRDINPSVRIWLEASKLMKSFLIEFGLTPASRSKLKLPKKDDGDELDALMGKGKPNTPRPPVGFQIPGAVNHA